MRCGQRSRVTRFFEQPTRSVRKRDTIAYKLRLRLCFFLRETELLDSGSGEGDVTPHL